MEAFIIAGGVPGQEDPLYPFSLGKPKAMIDVAGKPMSQWVLDAVCGAKQIDQVVIVGLEDDCGLHCTKPVHFIPDQGGMFDNARAGLDELLKINPSAEQALVLPGDTPAITSRMVEWCIEQSEGSDADFAYTAIKREVMEARYPGASRTYVKLKDVEVCGGDMHVVRPSLITDRELWERLLAGRKNIFKQATLIGIDTLFLLLTRRLTLEGAQKLISKRLGIVGVATLSPYAEIGMDADKPFQLEILRRDLASAGSAA